ncbi:hypothetical protein [Propioniciclava soli]|uniref:hypothetical protein n=1 Tax=Propioniciclava soli TaxID=2775081 RepID=UPI001E34C89F|nr:hypothetical protein [Propioniciclava soli]
MSEAVDQRTGAVAYPGGAADVKARRQQRALMGRALGLLHHLRCSAEIDEFVLTALIDAIVELEVVDTEPIEPSRAEITGRSWGELLDLVGDLLDEAGNIAPADAGVFLCEARRLQASL